MTPASVMKRFQANGSSLMSVFHKASPKMARLRPCRITIESTEIENCYQRLNRELRWLWNSVHGKLGWGGVYDNPKKMGIFKKIQCSHVCEQILSKFASICTYYHYTGSSVEYLIENYRNTHKHQY